jgi:septum formation protein
LENAAGIAVGKTAALSNQDPFDKTSVMGDKHQNARLILASKSPRRSDLLRQAGIAFDIMPSRFDEESMPMTDDPARYVGMLSRAKTLEVAAAHPERWVIGADTIVLSNGQVLGKPKDSESARSMLSRLSGQTHQVYTGFTISCLSRHREFTDVVCTDVSFKTLAPSEIAWYIHTGEPFDKAGAYAIQGQGAFLVRRINGSYTNVIGLPVCEVIERLIEEGVLQWSI